jgi:radical SAM protein with 4Fe4S-binding SPASM domain
MRASYVKPVNLIKAGYSYLFSSVAGKADIGGMPVSLGVELTNNCNLNCPQCASGSGQMKRKRGYMDIELYKKVIRELAPYLYNVNLYFQGEPMLHPQFFSFIGNSQNLHTVISTNGHYLSEENCEKLARSQLKKIIVSVDGTDQETYSAYRKNGSLEIVESGLKNLKQAGEKHHSPLKTEIQFLVNALNEHQIPVIKKLAKSFNATLSLKSMQIIDSNDMSFWLPSLKRFRRYNKSDEGYEIRNPMPDRCARLWFNPVITWDGNVLPCCFDKDAEYIMGNLNTDSFREIWNGPKFRIFRKSILTGRHMIDICRNCTSGLVGIKY